MKSNALTLAVVAASLALRASASNDLPDLPDDTPMNHVQVIGSHNSYKQAIDPPLLRLLLLGSPKAVGLDYSHATFTEQLELGLRSLELDLYHDPEGGRYADPLGLKMVEAAKQTPAPFDAAAMREPGFKVLHVADIDFRSSQPTLAAALAELRAWSEQSPRHLPILVTMNLKEEKAPVPGGVEPLPFDRDALAQLDEALVDGLGRERLLVPDDVRGEGETLEATILTRGWPALRDARGKFLFAVDEGGAKRRRYLDGHASLRGRVIFTTPAPGSPDSAVLVMNNPLRDEALIHERVAKGYLVRTRADAETREARTGDTTRLTAALRSGANVVSTDYYRPDPRFESGYRVTCPGGGFARGTPVFGPSPANRTNPGASP